MLKRQALVVKNFNGAGDEVSIKIGEKVVLIGGEREGDWCMIQNKDKTGFAPKICLELQQTESQPEEESNNFDKIPSTKPLEDLRKNRPKMLGRRPPSERKSADIEQLLEEAAAEDMDDPPAPAIETPKNVAPFLLELQRQQLRKRDDSGSSIDAKKVVDRKTVAGGDSFEKENKLFDKISFGSVKAKEAGESSVETHKNPLKPLYVFQKISTESKISEYGDSGDNNTKSIGENKSSGSSEDKDNIFKPRLLKQQREYRYSESFEESKNSELSKLFENKQNTAELSQVFGEKRFSREPQMKTDKEEHNIAKVSHDKKSLINNKIIRETKSFGGNKVSEVGIGDNKKIGNIETEEKKTVEDHKNSGQNKERDNGKQRNNFSFGETKSTVTTNFEETKIFALKNSLGETKTFGETKSFEETKNIGGNKGPIGANNKIDNTESKEKKTAGNNGETKETNSDIGKQKNKAGNFGDTKTFVTTNFGETRNSVGRKSFEETKIFAVKNNLGETKTFGEIKSFEETKNIGGNKVIGANRKNDNTESEEKKTKSFGGKKSFGETKTYGVATFEESKGLGETKTFVELKSFVETKSIKHGGRIMERKSSLQENHTFEEGFKGLRKSGVSKADSTNDDNNNNEISDIALKNIMQKLERIETDLAELKLDVQRYRK